MESGVEINHQAIAVKPPPLVKHREEKISDVHISEFSRVLMSTRFVDLYGVRDQRNTEIILEQELEIQIITEDKEAEEMLKEF